MKGFKIQDKQMLLVLVPHQDVRVELRKYSDSLLKAGYHGFYSFPWVAPLASLSQPLSTEELKHCAHSLREAINGEKIIAEKESFTAFHAGETEMALFGPQLNLIFENQSGLPQMGAQAIFGSPLDVCLKDAALKIINIFSPVITGIYLLPKDKNLHDKNLQNKNLRGASLPAHGNFSCLPPPEFSFRAFAIANMYWQPVLVETEGCTVGYKWKIGKLCWLPRKASVKKHEQTYTGQQL